MTVPEDECQRRFGADRVIGRRSWDYPCTARIRRIAIRGIAIKRIPGLIPAIVVPAGVRRLGLAWLRLVGRALRLASRWLLLRCIRIIARIDPAVGAAEVRIAQVPGKKLPAADISAVRVASISISVSTPIPVTAIRLPVMVMVETVTAPPLTSGTVAGSIGRPVAVRSPVRWPVLVPSRKRPIRCVPGHSRSSIKHPPRSGEAAGGAEGVRRESPDPAHRTESTAEAVTGEPADVPPAKAANMPGCAVLCPGRRCNHQESPNQRDWKNSPHKRDPTPY